MIPRSRSRHNVRALSRCVVLALAFALFTSASGGFAATIEVLYAPEDLPIERVVGLYGHAKRYIYVAVYGMTAPAVVKALVEAKHRGVDVRVITDRERMSDPKQQAAAKALRAAGTTTPVRFSSRAAQRANSASSMPGMDASADQLPRARAMRTSAPP